MLTLSAQECAGVRAGDVGCSAPAANASRLKVARVIAAALRLFPKPALGAHAWKVINALLACRTPLLGAHRHHCADCGKDHLVPHSCRNRHCPGCQAALSHEWLERQMQCLLPVTYFHVVFTLPHGLNALIAQNRRALHDLLFECASATLLEFGQNKFKTRLGVTAAQIQVNRSDIATGAQTAGTVAQSATTIAALCIFPTICTSGSRFLRRS